MGSSAGREFVARLMRLYAAMDAAYDQAAAGYGFVCSGCEENCCRTRFHHHTLIEVAGLRAGLAALPAGQRERIGSAARTVKVQQAIEAAAGAAAGPFCPLSEEGRCVLYAERPMICRLHGIPHEIRPPGRGPQLGPGCGEFHRRCGRGAYRPFDRTPLYTALARLEAEYKQALRLSRRVRLTIAEIILGDEALP